MVDWIVLAVMAIGLGSAAFAVWRCQQLSNWANRSAVLLRRRRENYTQLARVLRVAESVAGFGVWQYSKHDDKQIWSPGMRTLFGVAPDEQMVPGDADTLFEANGINMEQFKASADHRTLPLTTRVNVRGLDNQERSLDMHICPNRTHKDGPSEPLIALFMDVTQQIEREQDLQNLRSEAIAEAERAREEANRDPLTNLPNRRYLMKELGRALTQQSRHDDKLSLIFFDIDHFKAVNDTYGHLAGDKVLKRVARIASEQTREGDVIGRIGGEEFLWLVKGAGPDLTHMIGERLRKAVALQSRVGAIPPVTISVGCVTAEKGDNSLGLFARVDQALYDAKNSGRNAVRMAA